jgi:FKBP-type peptidyl-prolyl cis-trans isomerase SlyD
MKIEENTVVKMHYTVTTKSGDTIDSSIGAEPLEFIHGIGMLIPGLEQQLKGTETGFKNQLKIEAKDGYGERNEDAMHTLPKSGFRADNDEKLILGMEVQLESENGPVLAFVSEINEDDVVVDLNHPLAGYDLIFDIEILEVREATTEELELQNSKRHS